MLELVGLAEAMKADNEQLRILSFELGPNMRERISAIVSHNSACIYVIKNALMDELDKL